MKTGNQFSSWETEIRAGRTDEVRSKLLELNLKRLAKGELLQVANFARRLGLADLSVRILNPLARPEGPKARPASIQEMAEYGASLIRIGAVREGLGILDSIDASAYPEVLVLRAIGLFQNWDYGQASPMLEAYLPLARDPYQRVVAQVNLVSALIFQRKLKEAEAILDETQSICKKQSYALLGGNCLELRAQLLMSNENYDGALEFLENSISVVKDAKQVSNLWAKKWLAVVEEKKSPKKGQAFKKVREEAARIGEWETVRDCDYWIAQISGDRELFTHLFFGTPFESFRIRLMYSCPNIPEQYDWKLTGSASQRIFDIALGAEPGRGAQMKRGQLLHRLLAILASDFYRPFRLASLHSELFPSDFFNPWTSPDRVFKSIRRLRLWFKENSIPVDVQDVDGSYRIAGTGPYCLRFNRHSARQEVEMSPWEKIVRHFDDRMFSRAEALELLGLPKSTVQLILNEAIERGELARKGAGPAVRYRVVSVLAKP